MSDKLYNILKWIAIIAIPAVNTCIIAVASIWGFDPTPVVATFSAIGTFVGTCIGISCYDYNKKNSDKDEK